MFFIGGYVLILIFIVIGYYLLIKKKMMYFKCYGKELKENVITDYLRGHSVIVWKIIIPLLIISYLSAALTATPFLITLISKSLN